MKKLLALSALLGIVALSIGGLAVAEDEAQHGFIGPDGCKMCHKSEKKGNQYGKWLESRHAQAYATLASEEAAAAAAAAGIEGSPQEADACLSCHVTGHGVAAELLGKKYKLEDGVGCESCHGAGADYKKKSVMQDREASIAAGMIVPTEETCTGCHNENSPTFKGFDYEKMLAKIAHPYPAETADEGE
jgi:hypothetical protein